MHTSEELPSSECLRQLRLASYSLSQEGTSIVNKNEIGENVLFHGFVCKERMLIQLNHFKQGQYIVSHMHLNIKRELLMLTDGVHDMSCSCKKVQC